MKNKSIAGISLSLFGLVLIMYFSNVELALPEFFGMTSLAWIVFATWSSVRLYNIKE
jgi:hypothetical protein